MADSEAFTAREAEVYDRQIRLWGVEAQRRMKNSKVLVAGLTTANLELAKNLVLSGVSVSLLDSTPVTAEDLGANYFLSDKSIGKPKADACLAGIADLNPLVTVDVFAGSLAPADGAALAAQFSTVCVSGGSLEDVVELNDACRSNGVQFIASVVSGLHGLVFIDLGDKHEYVVPPPKGSDKKATSHVHSFPSLRDVLACKWDGLKRAPPALFGMQAVSAYRATSAATATATKPSLPEFAHAMFAAKSLATPPTDDTLATMDKCWGSELTFVAAILGGILGQEVTKAISCRDAPARNFFVFDGTDGLGAIATIVPPSAAPASASAPAAPVVADAIEL